MAVFRTKELLFMSGSGMAWFLKIKFQTYRYVKISYSYSRLDFGGPERPFSSNPLD